MTLEDFLARMFGRNCLRTLRRAGDETRTRDIFLGKEVLYQLSYTRVCRLKEGMMRQKRPESRNICLGRMVVSTGAIVS